MAKELKFEIRKLNEADLDKCISLFQETVHSINAKDYSSEELIAWAPLVTPQSVDNYAYWKTLLRNIAYVAEQDNQIIGFADISQKGYLDRLYVHKDYQRQGVAAALVNALEMAALQLGIKQITTEASITAKPFFLNAGFFLVKEQVVEIRGKKLKNYLMAKNI